MSEIRKYLDAYNGTHEGFWEHARALAEEFFKGSEDTAILDPVCPSECTLAHPDVAGPNMDIAQCPSCWMPIGVLRPYGESFGWHADDCALDIRHTGYCEHGGSGHVMPEGWKLRG